MLRTDIFKVLKKIIYLAALGLSCGISSSLTRNRTLDPCTGSRSLSHWTTREVPGHIFKYIQHPNKSCPR